MFRSGYDPLAANAPDWYVDADKNILKDNYLEAVRIAKAALKQCKDSGDDAGAALAACSYVKALLVEGDVWNARKIAGDAIEAAKGKDMKAALTNLLARVALKDRKISEAVKLMESALQMYKELGSEKGELSAMITSCVVTVGKGDLLEAEKLAAECLSKANALEDLRAKAAAAYLSYEIAMKDDVPGSAIEALDSIVVMLTDLDDPMTLGIATLMAADLQRSEGELQDAMNRAAEAAQKFDEAVEGSKKGDAVMCMAKAFHEAKQYDDSSEAATAALALYKATRNKEGQAAALRILAEVGLKKSKDFKEAIYKMEEVSFLYRALKNKKNEADALNELTKLQLSILSVSELKEPLRRARRAAQLYDEDYAGDTLGNAEANLTVAKIYLAENDDIDEGVSFCQRSAEVFEQLGNKAGEADALGTLSKLQYAMGNKDQGAKLAEKALDVANSSGNKKLQDAALDLVENKGQPKPVQLIELNEITLFVNKTRLAFFDEFESRRARYKAMDAKKEAKVSAIADSTIDTQAITSAKSKVEYTIRWTLVPNLDLSKMPIPKA
jgi:tetratricopeptide (TPR) repeat protein